MIIDNLELNKMYSVRDLIDPKVCIYLNSVYIYPDDSPIRVWIYRTKDYVYVTDNGVTTNYWSNVLSNFESHSKKHMIQRLIDVICEYFDTMYQDNRFISAIKIEDLVASTSSTDDLPAEIEMNRLEKKIESVCDAVYILSYLLDIER